MCLTSEYLKRVSVFAPPAGLAGVAAVTASSASAAGGAAISLSLQRFVFGETA